MFFLKENKGGDLIKYFSILVFIFFVAYVLHQKGFWEDFKKEINSNLKTSPNKKVKQEKEEKKDPLLTILEKKVEEEEQNKDKKEDKILKE